jgi:hypothetical protein
MAERRGKWSISAEDPSNYLSNQKNLASFEVA